MPFNSVHFAVFFAAIFSVYWAIGSRRRRLQNGWLIIANSIFYAYWDVRFLAVIWAAALVDFCVGLGFLRATEKPARRRLLWVSLIVNLGALGYFKYTNFFLDSWRDAAAALGAQLTVPTLSIVLPLGISFYTFSRLTYIFEVYRGRLQPTRDPVAFWAFSGFFPIITAGPIERGAHLLPQFERPRHFDPAKSKDALRQILWGLFKKIVIADNLAEPVKHAFGSIALLNSSDLAAGAFLFSVQVYADFSGYSDMAIGCARLLGFNVRRNFSYPYFSRDIGEFWRRWHISMSSWFRDYVYTPLSLKLSLNQRWRRMGFILVTFGVSGLWHGANWTFVVWGLLNGLYFAPLIFGRAPEHGRAIVAEGRLFPAWRDAIRVVVTFAVVCLTWIVFRADSLAQAAQYITALFTHSWLALPQPLWAVAAGCGLLLFEWITRRAPHGLALEKTPVALRWIAYAACVLAILVLGDFGAPGFFYAQF